MKIKTFKKMIFIKNDLQIVRGKNTPNNITQTAAKRHKQ